MKKISLITPLKDEIDNIPALLKAIESQRVPIKNWVIVENGSTDGSKECLDKISAIRNVENLKIINFSLPNEKYELGVKYATIVNIGLEHLFQRKNIEESDYIGILDADCIPPSNYYEDLIEFMERDERLGISSGQAHYLDGKHDGKNVKWPRGNCRLWKKDCLLSAGYIVGPSADALSVCKAELIGWKCYANKDLVYVCREVGKKVDYSYYGYSAYYRGVPVLFAFLKTINYFKIGRFSNGFSYLKGYLSSFFWNKDKVNEPDILKHNAKILRRKISEKIF